MLARLAGQLIISPVLTRCRTNLGDRRLNAVPFRGLHLAGTAVTIVTGAGARPGDGTHIVIVAGVPVDCGITMRASR